MEAVKCVVEQSLLQRLRNPWTRTFPYLLAACFFAAPVRAERTVIDAGEEKEFLEFHIFDEGELFAPHEISTWTLNGGELDALLSASAYWRSLVGPGLASTTPVIFVGTYDDENCAADIDIVMTDPAKGYTGLAANLVKGVSSPDPVAFITIGHFGSTWNIDPLEVLPHNGRDASLAAVLTHELGHAMGIAAFWDIHPSNDGYTFGAAIVPWDIWLADSSGWRPFASASPGADGRDVAITSTKEDGAFYLAYGEIKTIGGQTYFDRYAYFQGPHTLEALMDGYAAKGKLPGYDVPGVPINGWEGSFPDLFCELSHIELRNSMMSHQFYRNWGTFMEAELAILQDLGYVIDRKNFFGVSVYGDGQTITNTQGYFARNAEGTDWLPDTYNQTAVGIGLHIYGARNTVTQQADILSSGYGAAGIRVDGWQNSLTVADCVSIHANGAQGTGLMVTYGRDHNIVHKGDIRALGPGGVGVRFDFGSNILGNDMEYRGSWIRVSIEDGELTYWTLAPAINGTGLVDMTQSTPYVVLTGPLVQTFDVSGRVAGEAAAIYISENAYVEQINIMNGASLDGDIVSFWNPYDVRVLYYYDKAGLMTALTFGLTADAAGKATSVPDPDFNLTYRGDIRGSASLDMALRGGTLVWAGNASLHSFAAAGGTILKTDFLGGFPSIIAADTVSLDVGARVGFSPQPFAYGRELQVGYNPVLRLNAVNLVNNATPLPSSGNFTMGAWDYAWNGLLWDDDGSTLLVDTVDKTFHHQRGATDAQNAPLAIAMRNPGMDAVQTRMVRNFASRGGEDSSSAHMAATLLGSLQSGGMDFQKGEMPYSGLMDRFRSISVSEPRDDPSETNKPWIDSDKSSPEWLPLPHGGWEGGTGRAGLWITPAYSLTDHHGGRNFDIRGPSVAMGEDYRFTERWSLGLALAFDFPRYDSDDAEVTARGTTGILYSGLLLPWDAELLLSASYGGMHFEQERDVPDGRYASEYDSKISGLGVAVGRQFRISDHVLLRPFGAWDYFYVNRSSYDEGMGIYALSYESSQSRLYRWRAGADAAFVLARGCISARAFWSGLHGDTTENIQASFTLDPARNSFEAPIDGLDKNSLGLAAGFEYRLNDSAELSLEYAYSGGRDNTTHQGMLGFRVRF